MNSLSSLNLRLKFPFIVYVSNSFLGAELRSYLATKVSYYYELLSGLNQRANKKAEDVTLKHTSLGLRSSGIAIRGPGYQINRYL